MINWELFLIPAFCLAAYLFFGVVYAISIWRIRWKQLAAVYPSGMLQDAKSFGVRSVLIGKAGFPLGLDVKVTTAGLYLATPWFFRFELPPIFIPWKEMKPIGHYQFWLKSIAHVVFSVKLP